MTEQQVLGLDVAVRELPRFMPLPVVDGASYVASCAARRAIRCAHFTGTAWAACRLGISYDQVRHNPDGGASVFACVPDEDWFARGQPRCAKYTSNAQYERIERAFDAYCEAVPVPETRR